MHIVMKCLHIYNVSNIGKVQYLIGPRLTLIPCDGNASQRGGGGSFPGNIQARVTVKAMENALSLVDTGFNIQHTQRNAI